MSDDYDADYNDEADYGYEDEGEYDGGDYGDYGDYGYAGDEDLNLADEDYEGKEYNDFERAEKYGEYQEEKYGEERGAYERTEKQTGFVSMENRKMMTEEEKFKGDISICISEIKNNRKLNLKNPLPDVIFLQDKVSLLGDSVKYKNPIAYVLGFYCLTDTCKKQDDEIINKNKLKECVKIIKELEDVIGIEDVIRYAFYWNSYLI